MEQITCSSVRIWFDWRGESHHEMWWKEVAFIPPVGMSVVPFGDGFIEDWEFNHDDIVVDGFTFMAATGILVVSTENTLEKCKIPVGFDDAMERAGWIKSDTKLWG